MEKPQKDTSFSDMMKKFYEEDKKHDEKFSELEAKRDALRSRMHSSTARIQADIENAERLLEYVATEKMKVQLKRASRAKVAEPSVKKRASIKDIFTVRSQTLTSSGDDESSPAISSSRDTSMLQLPSTSLPYATSQVPFTSEGDEKSYSSSLQVPIAEVEALWTKLEALQAKFDAQKEAHIAELVRVKHQTVVDTVQRSIGVPFSDPELEKLVDGLWPPLAE